jgi:hypothetical protein
MIKFRTWYDTRIEEIEVVRETAKFVTEVDGQRWTKRSDSRNYFDTGQEAKDFLIDREKEAIGNLERQIAQHVANLAKIEERGQP